MKALNAGAPLRRGRTGILIVSLFVSSAVSGGAGYMLGRKHGVAALQPRLEYLWTRARSQHCALVDIQEWIFTEHPGIKWTGFWSDEVLSRDEYVINCRSGAVAHEPTPPLSHPPARTGR